MNTKSVLILSVSLLIAVVIITAAGIFVANKFHEAFKKRSQDEARYECALTSRVEVAESETVTGFYPAKQAYEECLKEKGL